MLIKFSVGNYLSFKDISILNFTGDSLKERIDFVHTPYLYNPELSILKSIAIYGYNSFGKTNFLKAYKSFIDIIFGSFYLGNEQRNLDISPFILSTETINEPSYFEIIFILDKTKYRYGFKATSQKIIEEWLFYADSGIRENILFQRVGEEFLDISGTWNKESESRINQSRVFLNASNLFLSVLIAQNNIPRIDLISNWLKGNIVLFKFDIYDKQTRKIASNIYHSEKYRTTIQKFIKEANLGFYSIFEKMDKLAIEQDYNLSFIRDLYNSRISEFELYTIHDIYDKNHSVVEKKEFNLLKNESTGTNKYFLLSCFLAYAIIERQFIVIDEIDSSFDFELLTNLVKLFNSEKMNKSGAQLLFTVHNTALLDNTLRRDQIITISKNEFGESKIDKIHTAKTPIRKEKSIEKEYRTGKIKKGRPKINDLPELFPNQ